jgi:serine/threonine protein kinase
MELAEGIDLAERIEQGPLPMHDALDIARQIAEGISEAHDKGVVHRDLKPANARVTPDGTVKILDFGLARAYEGSSVEGEGDPMLSPTITEALTQAGTVLGTAAYMSPEQARGRPVDRRADIWALGCILFETLSGRRTFDEETVTDTLAAVVRGEPKWDALPRETPPLVRRLLRRLLEKDPSRRMRDAGDIRLELEEALAGSTEFDAAAATPATQAGSLRAWPWALGGALVTAAIAIAAWTAIRPTPSEHRPPVRFEVMAATEETPIDQWSLTLSPDGRRVAWIVEDGEERSIWLREFDSLTAERLPDADGSMKGRFKAGWNRRQV